MLILVIFAMFVIFTALNAFDTLGVNTSLCVYFIIWLGFLYLTYKVLEYWPTLGIIITFYIALYAAMVLLSTLMGNTLAMVPTYFRT